MKRFGIRQIIPLCGLVFAGTFFFIGLTKLGFWDSKGPMPGFFPVIMSVVMLGTCLLALMQSFKEGARPIPREAFWVVLAVAAVLLTHFVLGLVVSLFLFVILWLRLIEKEPWKTTLKVLAVVAVIVLGVFRLWLNVRFPTGMLGTFLSGLF